VSIKSIERQIIDRGFELGLIKPRPAARRTGRRVAIVGSGPAGLTAAQELARKGHDVTVFEREAKPGGLLRYGIPDFKMEKGLIDRRLDQLQLEGVRFETGVSIGRDVSFESLQAEHDAVALALGAELPRDLIVPGRDLVGIHFAMDYLTDQNKVIAGEKSELAIDAKNKVVVVIGGGDTGSDCIGTARRQGALEIHQLELLPRPPSQRTDDQPWPQWPMILRTSHAHEEGANREWSITTKAFEGKNGQVTTLVTSRGNIATDLVILAMGFTGVIDSPLLRSLSRDSRGHVKTTPSFMTSRPGVFAAGDMKRGASLIVWAIAEGRQMANGIHSYLSTLTDKELR
ncbi:MAG: glutamate synthase subunit beta, partial [Bdellovibrionota bacterium]